MNRKTPEQVREEVCGSKIGHAGPGPARFHAARLRERTGGPMSAYRCPFCGLWHVGHVPGIENLTNIARVMRGLDTADPQPHEAPTRIKRRRRKKSDTAP